MAVTKTYLGLNEDGSPHFLYESDGHVVLTGKAFGTVTLADGTPVDVNDAVIEVASEEQAAEVADLIAQKFEAEGHPDMPGVPFEYVRPEA